MQHCSLRLVLLACGACLGFGCSGDGSDDAEQLFGELEPDEGSPRASGPEAMMGSGGSALGAGGAGGSSADSSTALSMGGSDLQGSGDLGAGGTGGSSMAAGGSDLGAGGSAMSASGAGGASMAGGAPAGDVCDAYVQVFSVSCVGSICHDVAASGGFAASEAAAFAVVGVEASRVDPECGLLIDPDSPQDSLILTKLNGQTPSNVFCGAQMPLNDSLNPSQIDCVEDWLTQFQR